MAFFYAIRRAASSAAPIVIRNLGRSSHNRHFSAAATALYRRTVDGLSYQSIIGSKGDLDFPPQRSFFSALAEKSAEDTELAKVLDDEIQCALECDDHDRVEEIPEGFPFEIQDEKGKNIITLRRKYQDEDIEVIVSMSSLVTGVEPDRDGGNGDGEEGDGDESSRQSSVPLTVRVSKGGKSPGLEFTCTAYPDEVRIDAMSVREDDSSDGQEMLAYEGPDFSDLDENLQKAFHKYLELRGITAMTTNFLHEYMINKDSREYLHWLRNLKEFIEK